MQKIFVKKKSLQGVEWEKPTVYPGAIWEEWQSGDIRVLEVGDVKTIGFELEKMFLSFAERISNISIYQTGASRSEGGQKTLGEIQATISQANNGLDKFISNCHHILIKICKWTVSYYRGQMPVGIPRKKMNDQGQLVALQDPTRGPYWEDKDLDGEPDFIWNGTLLNSSKEWKIAVANDLQDRFLPQQMIAGNLLSVWTILKMGLDARGIKDWQGVLPPKEAIIQEMRRMEAESRMARAAAPAPGRNVLGPVNKDKVAAVLKAKAAGVPA